MTKMFSVYVPMVGKALGMTEIEAASCEAAVEIKPEYKHLARELQKNKLGRWGAVETRHLTFDLHATFDGERVGPLPSVKIQIGNEPRYEASSFEEGKPRFVMVDPRAVKALAEHMSDVPGLAKNEDGTIDESPRFMPARSCAIFYLGEENFVAPENRRQIVEQNERGMSQRVRKAIENTDMPVFSIPSKIAFPDSHPRVGYNGWKARVTVPMELLLEATCYPSTSSETWESTREWTANGATFGYALTGKRGSVREIDEEGESIFRQEFVEVDSIFISVVLADRSHAIIHLPRTTALRICASFLAHRFSESFVVNIGGTIILPPEFIPDVLLPLEAMVGVARKAVVKSKTKTDEKLAPTKTPEDEKGPDTMRGIGIADTVPPQPQPTADAAPDSHEQEDEPAGSGDFPVQTFESDEEDVPEEPPQVDDTVHDSGGVIAAQLETWGVDHEEDGAPIQVDDDELEDQPSDEPAGNRDSIVPMPVVEVGEATPDEDALAIRAKREAKKAERKANKAKRKAKKAEREAKEAERKVAAANTGTECASPEPCDEAEVERLIASNTPPPTTLGELFGAIGQLPVTPAAANGNNGGAPAPPTSDGAPPAS